MTATREAIVLPMMLLTVTCLGGLRIATTIRLLPPALMSLVLGVMLVASLVHAGVLSPPRLMSARRSALENLSGLVVLVTLFAASAQIFTLVTPDHGLLNAAFSICFFVQLATTLAGVTGRRNLLRSLAVLLGSAFLVRFVVLESLYAPDGGVAKRVVTAIVEGASLGAIQYEPAGVLTGYVAFFTLVLYFIAVALLPSAAPGERLTVPALRAPSSIAPVLLIAAIACSACGGSKAGAAQPADDDQKVEAAEASRRDDAMRRVRVWQAPPIPIGQFDFAANPPGGFLPSDQVSCRFTIQKLSGLTPKFHCRTDDGRVLKIKYGARNAELQAEVAGTRLLRSLGFPADDMFVVNAVQCAGCPLQPFRSLQCRERLGLDLLCFGGRTNYERVRTFTPAVVEQRMAGTEIEAAGVEGWSWYELDRIDPARGGASRAEIDALRLLAIVLAHWDNKGPNQRLICPSGRELPDGGCPDPVAMIQDLGATFGPNRVDLINWRHIPVWRDRSACTVSMRALPYGGATFPEARISEAGRLLISGLLEQLSARQLTELFTASRIIMYDQLDAEARDVRAWVRVFLDKARQIREGPACPQ